ncbi:hypothetical protein GGQ73_003532 [Rhizobium skierniewicense]|uniref:Uncharacterized protein n=1 Tax=Rhizobium skierniewicense TaxID=984260 RepID=A0A7W6CDQ6_9HYPH|nr:hypothetical protein [Rhizobium skierniewicense]MBB3947564.1 hypothetical protein [Rhizobium skierniewicense]
MNDMPLPPAAFSKGYALCSPDNQLLPETFAQSERKAISKTFKKPGRKKAWAEAQEKGWSVRFVYMRVFVPVFHSSSTTDEVFDDE